MENKVFRGHLIRKGIISGVFALLTIAAVVAVNAVNNGVITPNEGFITAALCSVDSGGAKNSMGDRLAVEIEQEGIVLAKNDNNCLPLSKDTKRVNVFGYDAYEWVISNSGSGTIEYKNTGTPWGILEALDNKGIEYNTGIINYYKSFSSPRNYEEKSYSSSYNSIYRLVNPSLSSHQDYKALYDAALEDDTDTAIVCIGRWGGEHLDPPHQQINNIGGKKSSNPDRGYLEITEEEEELLTAVGQDYENVIVIINSVNIMQMDFMTEIDGLDACLLVGPTGTVGAKAIPQVLWGDINPSGRTADTWPMDHRYNVTYYTSGYFPNANSTNGSYYNNVPSGGNLANGINTANFADYIEGIYVGYKWFETADAEGFWDNDPYNGYENVVAYPFGYGLSYTTFSWDLVDSKPAKNVNITDKEEIEVQVKVTNTGSVAGRDVVEAYLTAEYYPGEIEKASVKLVAFQKTKLLMPGESEIVTLNIKARDFLQFDCYDANGNGHAGYELDRGYYDIKLMTDAHSLKEHMGGGNTIRYNVPTTIEIDEDPETGNEVKPLFTGEDAIDTVSMDGKSIGEEVAFITREDFAPLLTNINPSRPWNKGLELSPDGVMWVNSNSGGYWSDDPAPTSYSDSLAAAWDNATVDVFGKPVRTGAPTFGKSGDLKVMESNGQISELGIRLVEDYDSPEWEDLLDQLTWSDGTTIMKGQSYSRPGLSSVGLTKPGNANFSDAEGACQVGATVNGKRLTGYPDPTVQGQCWNEDICYLFGLSEAKDMTLGGKDFLYGPASNIHRSPYGGRNAEYHSEDGYLASRCLSNVTKGLSDGGKNGFIKHFCMNDNEYHRVGLFVWATEQALREVYLRPFEEAIKNGEATAVMSSFNRIGAVWTGGSQALIQGVLRNEWGFKGMTITDYTENDTLQNADQMFRAGGNYVLSSSHYKEIAQNSATNRYKWRVREGAKQVIYGTIRPLYDNYMYNQDTSHKAIVSSSKAPYVWWKPLLHCVEGLLIVSFAFGCLVFLLPNKELREEIVSRASKKKQKGEHAE